MFIRFRATLNEWIELGSLASFWTSLSVSRLSADRVCKHFVKATPPCRSKFYSRYLTYARIHSRAQLAPTKNTPRPSVPRSLFAPAEQYIYRKAG